MPDLSAKYVLVGGGVACVWAAIGIREHDKDGSILMVREEPHMPYDRPPLSKGFLGKPDVTLDDITSKLDSFYPDNNIGLELGVRAEKLDPKHKMLTLSDGRTVGYEKLLIATGARADTLHVHGDTRTGVHYLHTVDDAEGLRQAIVGAKIAVLIGGGYISLEAGSQMIDKGLETTIVTKEDYPWGHFVSRETGDFLRTFFESKGARFVVGETATSIMGGPVAVTGAGAKLPGDVVIIGVGVSPNVELAAGGGLESDPRHGVYADESLRTNDPDIYTAGDVAYFYDRTIGKRWRADHHLNAKWQGKLAGENMAGADKQYDQVAYFFSDMFDLHMCLRGDAEVMGNTAIYGNLAEGEFVEVYGDDGGVVHKAIAFSKDEPKLDKISDKLEELIRSKKKIADVTADAFEV